MLRTFLAMAAATALLLPIGARAQPADLIVTNAKIATLDAASTTAQALAVREGRIVAVGGAGESARSRARPRAQWMPAGAP